MAGRLQPARSRHYQPAFGQVFTHISADGALRGILACKVTDSGINFYDKGQLSSGFCGWRVVATIRGKRYQKYFSLNRPSKRIPEKLWFHYQETRARYYEA